MKNTLIQSYSKVQNRATKSLLVTQERFRLIYYDLVR